MPRRSLEIGTIELDQFLKLLMENSEDLKMLLSEVSKVSDRVANICELSSFKRVEEKMALLENLIKALPENSRSLQENSDTKPTEEANSTNDSQVIAEDSGSTNVSKCNSWRDFKEFASKAQTMYFSYQSDSRTFEAEALKGDTVITYSGKEPTLDLLLKLWLRGNSNLETPKNKGPLGSTS